jgi:hypothetical protein
MYCQQCGAEMGNGNFCRKCGAASGGALSVPQAEALLAPPDYEKGFKKLFMGLAFLIIAIFPIFSHGRFWWWMLFPAVPLLAAGIGALVRSSHASGRRPAARLATLSAEPARVAAAQPDELSRARDTSELVPPPASVIEGTTRHLDREKVRRD